MCFRAGPVADGSDAAGPDEQKVQKNKFTFEAADEIPWTLDGEFGGAVRHAEITNCARAITFATGEGRKPELVKENE